MNSMQDDRSLVRDVTLVLAESAPLHEPDHLLDSVLFTTSRKRPRPRLLALIKESPMRLHSTIAFGSPPARIAATILAILVLMVLAAGTVLAGSSLISNDTSTTPSTVTNGLIAYDSDGDIWVADADGSNPRVLVGGPDEDTSPVWSPDGSRLAFWSKPVGGFLQLAVVDAQGGGRHAFEQPDAGHQWEGYKNGESGIDWGPDGRIMLKSTYGGLWVLDVDDGSLEHVELGGLRSLRVGGFDWSDDGSKLAFVSWDDPPRHYEYIFESDMDGAEPRQLVKADPVGGSLASVRWDPSGTRITYTRGVDDPAYDGTGPGELERGVIDLYVLDADSGAESLIRSGLFYMPVWSPAGDRIAYGARDLIGITSPNGSDPVSLGITDVSPGDIIWSPDGTKVASVTGSTEPDWNVVTMDVAGGIPTYIDAPGMVGGPSLAIGPAGFLSHAIPARRS